MKITTSKRNRIALKSMTSERAQASNALVIVLFQVQYDQYCPSFSYFTAVNMRNEENIGHISRDEHVVTSLLLMEKYQ